MPEINERLDDSWLSLRIMIHEYFMSDKALDLKTMYNKELGLRPRSLFYIIFKSRALSTTYIIYIQFYFSVCPLMHQFKLRVCNLTAVLCFQNGGRTTYMLHLPVV